MRTMTSKRRSFTPEFKREAARLVIDTDRSIRAVAEEIGVGEQSLGRWVKIERESRQPTKRRTVEELEAENARLTKELYEARKDNEFLGKAAKLLRAEASGPERFELMHVEKHNHQIKRMARLLGVSASGYYAWVGREGRPPGPRAARQRQIDAKVRDVHAESGHVYGAPRISAQLGREGINVNRKTVAASMRRQGLEGISPRMFSPVTTIAGVRPHRIPDRVKRTWDQGELDKVWISDVTYLRTGEGWLYLCLVTDAHSRRVLGWSMSRVQNSELIESALRRACLVRQNHKPDGLVFHADRGAQYTSEDTYKVCWDLGLAQSVGRTGVCFDNAMAESVFSKLKTEFYDRRVWATRAEARAGVVHWIEQVYNRRRLHSALGMLPPVEYEHSLREQQSAGEIERLQATA
ncbi:IS3 family transposase [Citricoccus muralis]|uniref:IS3 family transposase n=1 Tax=Citricoccus muralis TaxID=169134 RepID=A0ABY8HA87_9MICC|nr:IS3 family transposase [Citricoccus muralis]WFP17219.1 IS3 family transposase [Citricoccus muralis]WFP17759.1 IS3 family transposase [Citricoccus muralis]